MINNTKLSAIDPCYNTNGNVIVDIKRKSEYLDTLNISYELIYVFDGFFDEKDKASFAEAKKYEKESSFEKKNVRVFGYEKNCGKGCAVREGLRESLGEIVGFIDFGTDIDERYLCTFYRDIIESNLAFVIANKYILQKKQNMRSLKSKLFSRFVKIITGIRHADTQTGIKMFRKDIVKMIENFETDGFSFDIEILLELQKKGVESYREIPILIDFQKLEESQRTVNIKKIICAGIDVLRLGWKYRFRE